MSKIDNLGLQIDGYFQIKEQIENFLKSIYGENINLDPNSPDGQFAAIFSQIIADQNELIQDVNASFDPDQAVGVVLDQRVKLNGITRKQGSYTRVNVSVFFNGSTTIKGLDQYDVGESFQVSDSTGNILVCEQTISGINGETRDVSFRALEYGELIFNAGSITTIITTQLGVDRVTNINAQYVIGSNEESDLELKIRRKINSLQKSSCGEIEELIASLQNIEGVDYANVLDNDSSSIDSYGIPANGIWIIVSHIENDEVRKKIGEAIYKKRIPGTPMKNDFNESSSSSSMDIDNQGFYVITRPDGRQFTAYWTKPSSVNLNINITAKMLDGSNINLTQIEETIRNNFVSEIGKPITTNKIENILLSNIEGLVIVDISIYKDGEVPVEDYLLLNPDERFVINTINIVQG